MHMNFSLSYHTLDELECSPHSLKKYLYFQIQFQMKINHLQLQKNFFKTIAILTNTWLKKQELTATLPHQKLSVITSDCSKLCFCNATNKCFHSDIAKITLSSDRSALCALELFVLQTSHSDACICNFLRRNQSPQNLAISVSELWKMLTLPTSHTEVISSLKSCVLLLNSGLPVTWYHHSKPESWPSLQPRRKKNANKSKPTYLEI